MVIQSFALHSSEVAASQTAAEFVYDSVTRKDDEAQRILDNVISIVMPSINDGTQMIADWYGARRDAARSRRPAVALSEVFRSRRQSRRVRAQSSRVPAPREVDVRDWMPQAYVDHHQMGGGNARLYIPPYAEPIRRTAIRWCGVRSRGGARTWATGSRLAARPA